MPSDFYLFSIGVILNLVACLIIWGTQELDAKNGRIPKRHCPAPKGKGGLPVLYCQDMFVFLIGDLIGLSIINGSFIIYFWNHSLSISVLVLGFAIFLTDTFFLYLHQRRPDHRPDAGSPDNKLSKTGWAHLFYHGYFAAFCIVFMIKQYLTGINALSLYIFLTGGIIWIAASLFDLKRGIFNRTAPVITKQPASAEFVEKRANLE